MRFPAFAVFAFLASGCTIHVVEQPAAPVMLAEAPRPARVRPTRPHPIVYVPVAATAADPEPVARPTPVATQEPVARPVVATRTPIAARPPRDRPHGSKPAPRPSRIPFKTLPPEARAPQLGGTAPPRKHRRPQKVKQDEPVKVVSSTSVAKSQ